MRNISITCSIVSRSDKKASLSRIFGERRFNVKVHQKMYTLTPTGKSYFSTDTFKQILQVLSDFSNIYMYATINPNVKFCTGLHKSNWCLVVLLVCIKQVVRECVERVKIVQQKFLHLSSFYQIFHLCLKGWNSASISLYVQEDERGSSCNHRQIFPLVMTSKEHIIT